MYDRLATGPTTNARTSVTAAAYTAPSDPARPLPTVGDQNPKPSPKPAPPEKLGDDLLRLPAEPKLQGTLPGLRPEEPAATEKPYAPPGGLTPLNQARPEKNGAKPPPLEQDVALQQHEFKESCPTVKDLKHIADLSTNITPSEGDLPHDCPLGGAAFQARAFRALDLRLDGLRAVPQAAVFRGRAVGALRAHAGAMVAAGGLGRQLLHHHSDLAIQDGVGAAARVHLHARLLPAGRLSPYMIDPLPLSVRGALFEAGAWVGGVAIFP